MQQNLSRLVGILSLLCAPATLADTLELRDGRSLSGRLKAEAYTLESNTEGRVVVPLAVIKRVEFPAEGQAVVSLVDGRQLTGRWADGEVLLQRDLFSNSFAVGEILRLVVDPRAEKAQLPAGSRVKLLLAEWLSSKGVAPGQPVKFCLAEDLKVGGLTVLPRGTPAMGKIAAAQAAGKTSRQGELSVEAGTLTTPDGKEISLSGAGEFEGGLNAANFVAMGVLGFLAAGEDVLVPAGTPFEAQTSTGEELELVTPPEADEAWRYCREFFRFAGGLEVPLETLVPKAAYAPFDRALTFSLPVSELKTGTPHARRLGNLLVYDVYLPNFTVELVMGRKLSELKLSLQLAVLPSHDKTVSLRAAIFNGATRIATDDRLNIDAEEEKTRTVELSIRVPTETLERLRASAEARLRVEMTVR